MSDVNFQSSANRNGKRWGLNYENKLDLALQYGERCEFKIENYEKLDVAQHGERWGFQLQR